MTASTRRLLWIPVIALYATAGLAFVLVPCLFLMLSAKSPLRSTDAGYVQGFGLGVIFVFFVFLGLVLVGVAIKGYRLSFGPRPPHEPRVAATENGAFTINN